MVLAVSPRRPKFTPLSTQSPGIAVAVAGCGYWGSKHVRVLSSLRSVSRVVVTDPSLRARDAILAAYPNVEVVDDIDGAIDRVDALIVATPPRDHCDVALRAVRAGRHVLVEKPMSTTLADARTLVAEAKRCGVALMVGHTFEFNPAVHELRRRMDVGEFGTVRYLHSARLNLGQFRSDVNVVWDLAPHDISIMNYLLRSTPTSVRAWGSAHVTPGVVDLAHFQLDYPDRGVTGYGHVSWLDPRKVRQVTVVGSRKMAVYDDLADERLRLFDRGVERAGSDAVELAPHVPLSYRYGDIVSPHIEFQEPLMLEDKVFVDCIRTGAPPPSDGASGMAVIAVLDAIDRALLTGQPVAIDPATTSPTLVPAIPVAVS